MTFHNFLVESIGNEVSMLISIGWLESAEVHKMTVHANPMWNHLAIPLIVYFM